MWRDVYGNVLDLFYSVFCTLEHNGALNPDSELDLYSLHWVFIPHIQRHLQSFKETWNNHGLRTEHNRTPLQLWQHTPHDQDAGPMQVKTQCLYILVPQLTT